jgi:putative ABC transport system permease protein
VVTWSSWRPRRRRRALTIEPTHLSLLDLAAEALAGLFQRPGRTALTGLGTVLGVGAFVAVLGMTFTAGGAINATFNATTATEVTVRDVTPASQGQTGSALPADADQRILRVNGTVAGGVYWTVDQKLTADAGTRPWPRGGDAEQLAVVAATPGMLRAARPHLVSGRTFDAFHVEREQPVVLVSDAVAERLRLPPLQTHPVLFVGGVALHVIGVYDAVVRQPELLLSVVVPSSFATRVWGPPTAESPAAMVVETRLGAAQQVASQAAVALRPDAPDRLRATAPPDPRALRDQVNRQVSSLAVVLAALSLVVGALGIANSTLVAVMERIGEIGLRRSVGARPRHIAAQFLVESMALGTLGGLTGTAVGTLAVVLVSVVKGWTPLMEPVVVVSAPALGTVVGLLAGLYPAWRAARIEPIEALRR